VATKLRDAQAEEEMSLVIDIVRSIRNARAQSKIDPSRRIEARIHASNKPAIESHRQAIETLARVQPLAILYAGQEGGDEGAVVLLVKDVRVVLPMTADLDAERQHLENDKQAVEARIASLKTRLSDDAFLSKAPASVVEKERGKLVDSQMTLEKIEQRLAELADIC